MTSKPIFLALLVILGTGGFEASSFAAPPEDPVVARTDKSSLTPAILDEIIRSGEKFSARFKPSEHFFIGLGRSPHVVLSYIEANRLGDVRYIPMSGVKNFYDSYAENGNRKARVATAKAHIREFLPTPTELAGRKIMIVDFVDTAVGLRISTDLIAEAMFENGYDLASLGVVALHSGDRGSLRYYRNPLKQEVVAVPIHGFRFYETAPNAAGIHDIVEGSGSDLIPGALLFSNDTWVEKTAPVSSYDWLTLEKSETYSERRAEYEELLMRVRERTLSHPDRLQLECTRLLKNVSDS